MKFSNKNLLILGLSSLLIASFSLTACSNSSTKVKEETPVITEDNKESETKVADEKVTENQEGKIKFNDYASKVATLVKENWPSMNKVWPTYNYENHNFVLFYLNDETGEPIEAVLINSSGFRKLEKSEYENISYPNAEGYTEIEFENKPSIAMSVDDYSMNQNDSVNQIYKTATHELVHFYYQSEINVTEGSSRYQSYPIDKNPRLIRRMLYARLIDAFENPDKEDEYLSKAKFWLDKYNLEYKSESDGIRSTDIAESIARFSENLSTFIGKELSQEEIKDELNKSIPKDIYFISADGESYEIGNVAAYILDRKSPEWKNHFYSSEKNVEEYLLKDVKPLEDTMDTEIEKGATKEVDDNNINAKEQLKDIVAASVNKSIPYLHLDTSKTLGSFTAETMYEYENLFLLSSYSNRFETSGKKIELNSISVIEGNDENEKYVRIPLTMDFKLKDDVLTIDSKNLKIDGIKVETSSEDGRTIYKIVVDK